MPVWHGHHRDKDATFGNCFVRRDWNAEYQVLLSILSDDSTILEQEQVIVVSRASVPERFGRHHMLAACTLANYV